MVPHTPAIGVLLLSFSTLLIFFELNRPGLVLPGTLGLLGVLLAVNSLRQWHLSLPALWVLAIGTALAGWPLRHRVHRAWAFAAAFAYSLGLSALVNGPGSAHVPWFVAVPCGLLLGAAASVLARIAFRARRNKGLN